MTVLGRCSLHFIQKYSCIRYGNTVYVPYKTVYIASAIKLNVNLKAVFCNLYVGKLAAHRRPVPRYRLNSRYIGKAGQYFIGNVETGMGIKVIHSHVRVPPIIPS